MWREHRWALALLAIAVAGLVVAGHWRYSLLEEDAFWFSQHSSKMLAGQIPYIDFEFEHLPFAIVPMLVTGLLSKALGTPYAPILWLVMTAVLYAVGVLVNKVGNQLGVANAAHSWLKVSWALIPLAVFRLDAVSVLLTLMALYLLLVNRENVSALAMGAAIVAKGWPIVLSVIDWWRGKKARAVITLAATCVGAAALLSLPLFRTGREFFGVHTETVTGAAVALWRLATGEPLQSGVAAGAIYIEVGAWALFVNLVLGITLAVKGIRRVQGEFDWRHAMDLMGVLTIALMLASPLLSAQFIFWVTPFAALSASKRARLGTTIAVVLTGMYITTWLSSQAWWWGIVVVRNIVLLWTGWTWSKYLSHDAPTTAQTTAPPSTRNRVGSKLRRGFDGKTHHLYRGSRTLSARYARIR
jgi:hypothetical protein